MFQRVQRASVSPVSSPTSPTPTRPAPFPPDPLGEFFSEPATQTFQSVVVDADAETTFRAVKETDLAASFPVRALTLARALPDRIVRRLRKLPDQPAPQRTLEGLIEAGWWVRLRDESPTTLALGLVMWDDRVQHEGQSRELFDHPGTGAVRVGWELRVQPISEQRSLLITETMTKPVGDHASRRLHRYWSVISPFASFTRRLVINRIARTAEQYSPTTRVPV
jgi:hypothetical protein